MSLWLLTVFFGNMLDAALTALNVLSGLAFFLFFAFLMFFVACLYIWAAHVYKMRDYSQSEDALKRALGNKVAGDSRGSPETQGSSSPSQSI